MPSVFLECQAFFSYAEPFFALASIFLPGWSLVSFASIFLLCWALLTSSEHFSATLRSSQLFQSFLFYAERCFGSSKCSSAMLSILFCSAKHISSMLSVFSAMPSNFQLCWALLGSWQIRKNAPHKRKMLSRAKTPLSIAEKWLEEPRSA